jgi:hypothetical protein
MVDEQHLCSGCGQPAGIGTLGALHMHWHCTACFSQIGTAHEVKLPDVSAVAVGTGVTITLGAKTARFVASALDEWVTIISEVLNTVGEDDDGWTWNDVPMVAGAAKLIRDEEAKLRLGAS